MNMNAPYSQCDAKGRCIRHPTIQMSRKKKLGGWKKLLSLCPMCAMELMTTANDNNGTVSVNQICGEVGGMPQQQSRGMEPPSHHSDSISLHSNGSGQRQRSGSHRRPPSQYDDRSVTDNRSVRSAPSTYNRRDSNDTSKHRHHSSSDSSCDTTVDMSYSSEYSSPGAGYGNASSRVAGNDNGMRRSNSRGSVHSQGSQRSGYSHSSARSSGSHHSRQSQSNNNNHRRPHPSQAPNHNVNTIDQNQEQFVCGMEFEGMYYTGQIHVQSQLPHGLGTLRSDVDGTMLEGQWRFGRLVQESNASPGASSQSRGYQEDYPQEYQEQQQEYADYHCMPCTEGQTQNPPPANNYQESLCEGFDQYATIQDVPSSASGSIAETIHDDIDTQSESSAEWSRNSSYSAREAKQCLPPRHSPATQKKLLEYEKYVVRCDEDEDYYTRENNSRRNSDFNASQTSMGSCDRQRKVRFREDP